MKKFLLIAFLNTVFALTFWHNTFAIEKTIDAVTGVVEVSVENDVDLSQFSNKLKDIETALKNQYATEEDIKHMSAFLGSTETLLNGLKKQFGKEEEFIQKRIDALGEEPKEGDTELEIITQKRQEFAQEKALQKAKIAEVDIMLAKIYELGILIVNTHNREFLNNLTNRHQNLLIFQNFYKSAQSFAVFLINIAQSPAKWLISSDIEMKKDVVSVLVYAFLALILGIFLRKLILKKFGYKEDIQNPNYEQKLKAAAFVAVARGIIPALIIGGLFIWTIIIGISNDGFFGIVVVNTLHFLLYILVGLPLARVVFAPYYENWRLVNVSSTKAKKITRSFYWSIALICICLCLEKIANQANYPVELLYFLSSMSTAAKAFSLMLVVNALTWQEDDLSDEQDQLDDLTDDNSISAPLKINFFVIIFSLVMLILALYGYDKLAEFILNRLIFSALLIFAFLAMKNVVFDASKQLTSSFLSHTRKKLKVKILRNIDLIQSVVISPLLLIVLFLALLNLWGVPSDIIFQAVKKLLFGFTIGNLKVSLISIFFGIAAFFLIVYLFRILSIKLDQNVFSKLNMDNGIRNSLLTTLHFFGTIIAALIAIVSMGVNLTNLALIAGALSIGIGFGLQNIINNLVSGLIILFERPFNVGDWVIINGEEGKIKQVNIRSTIVETFKRSSVIIPNANLLSSSVTNLTHDNNVGRYSVKVGVAYGSDVEKVKKILLESASINKYILRNPAPYVVFQDFGESSLDFELRFYVNDIWSGWTAPSDIRFEINRRFNEEGIEIPFPQVVVHKAEEDK